MDGKFSGPVNGTHARTREGLREADLDELERERVAHWEALREAAQAWHDAMDAEAERMAAAEAEDYRLLSEHARKRPACRGMCSQGRSPCATPLECVIHTDTRATARFHRFLRRFWRWLTGASPW